MKACFIGHRTINNTEQLRSLLKKTVLNLIDNGVTTFLFGSASAFDKLSLETVTSLKKDYPFIKRIYVRSAYQQIDNNYRTYLLKYYDDTYFSVKLKNAGKYAYVERNYEMIDSCLYCIFYYNSNYIAIQKNSIKNSIPSQRNSGTKIAYDYAKRKNKKLINIYQEE